jgi:hypothetical protein
MAEEGHFWLPSSDFWLLTSDFWLLTSDFWLLSSDFWLLTSDFRLLTSDFRLLTSDFWLLSSDFWLLSSDFWVRTSFTPLFWTHITRPRCFFELIIFSFEAWLMKFNQLTFNLKVWNGGVTGVLLWWIVNINLINSDIWGYYNFIAKIDKFLIHMIILVIAYSGWYFGKFLS